MKKSTALMVLAAVTAFGGTAFGQLEAPKLTILPQAPQLAIPVGNAAPNIDYTSRIEAPIFDNTSNLNIASYVSGVGAGNTCWANEIDFTGTVWAGATGRVATNFWSLLFAGSAPVNPWYWRIRMYTPADFSYNGATGVGTDMINPAATPFYDVVLGLPVYAPNTGNFLGYAPVGGIPFPDGGDRFYMVMTLCSDAAGTTVLPITAGTWGFTRSLSSTDSNCASPGFDSSELARDQNGNFVLNGAALAGDPMPPTRAASVGDHRNNYVGTPLTPMSPSFLLNYDAAATAPTPTHSFGCLADGTTTRALDSIGANGVAWYELCLNGDATDVAGTAGQFVDMHTNGSNFDTVVGVYDATGAVVWTNDDDGANLTSSMSFGIGRRSELAAGGAQRDGSAFSGAAAGLPAAGGPYLLGVAGFGASFLPGWSVAGTWTGGNISVGFETNTNGAALAASVAPVPGAGDDLGTPVAPGVQSLPAQLFEGVRWYKVNTCLASNAIDTVTFDFSQCAAGTNWQMAIFDASGNQMAVSTGSPPANLVYGDAPSLPAGTYYVGMSYNFGVDYAMNPTTSGRWHMRDRATSNWTGNVNVLVNWLACSLPCDGDVNCDFALDGFDVEVQEKAVGGDMTDYCQADPDFNHDFALDGFDVEAVEVVVGGGPCP